MARAAHINTAAQAHICSIELLRRNGSLLDTSFLAEALGMHTVRVCELKSEAATAKHHRQASDMIAPMNTSKVDASDSAAKTDAQEYPARPVPTASSPSRSPPRDVSDSVAETNAK